MINHFGTDLHFETCKIWPRPSYITENVFQSAHAGELK